MSPRRSPDVAPEEQATLDALIPRIGRLHVQQRLGLERDFEAHVFGPGRHFFHVENWYSFHGLVRAGLRLSGLWNRAHRNARHIQVRQHEVRLAHLPAAFDGFTLLHLTDLHLDAAPDMVSVLIETVRPLDYDLCVMTGDYRLRTYGPFAAALRALAELRPNLRGTVYAILGNHDSLRMVPPMQSLGYTLLLNEWTVLRRGGEELYLAGIEDAHFYRLDNFHRAADEIPPHAASILLSHTPEAYRHAAHANFDLMLCGHTHGGQICLPNGRAILTDSDTPRRFVRGPWQHHRMIGYTSTGSGTSIIDARLNCLPEVTLHRLVRG
jgi:predicted MPP superfamily phosphohydrolase